MTNKRDVRDVGEYIPYAKKHKYTKNDSSDGINSQYNQDKEIKLSDLWQEPDWQQLSLDGCDTRSLAIVCGIYHRLAKKPIKGRWVAFDGVEISGSMWKEAYIEVVEWLKDQCDPSKPASQLAQISDKFANKFDSKIGTNYEALAAGLNTNRKYATPFGMPNNAGAFAELLPLLDWPLEVDHKKIPVVPVRLTEKQTSISYYKLAKRHINKATWDDSLYPIDNRFDSFEEAAAALQKYRGEEFLKKPKGKRPKAYNPTKKIDLENQSQPEIKHVSVEQLRTDFGLRGVQFGSSLTDTESSRYVDNVHYSLTLLSQILGIPGRWIGAGKLGLAIGARGAGNAAAHFEPELNVINLTRRSGPGTIAHEIMHSFDVRFERKWYNVVDEAVLLSEAQWWTRRDHNLDETEATRLNAFISLFDACTDVNSDYVKNAEALSGQVGGKRYWCLPSELLARAFEAYIQDKLEIAGIHQQWLAQKTKESDYKANGMHPYPCGNDRAKIFQSMEKNLPVLFSK
jgi:hypothetical protein